MRAPNSSVFGDAKASATSALIALVPPFARSLVSFPLYESKRHEEPSLIRTQRRSPGAQKLQEHRTFPTNPFSVS